MPSDVVSFVLSLPPTVNHMYARYRRHVVLKPEAAAWKQEAHLIALTHFDEPWRGSVVAVYEFYFKDGRSDISNRIKALEDALEGVAYINDRQIVQFTCYKFVDPYNPRVEVALWKK